VPWQWVGIAGHRGRAVLGAATFIRRGVNMKTCIACNAVVVILAVAIPAVTPQELGQIQYDTGTGEFSFSIPTPYGELYNWGVIDPLTHDTESSMTLDGSEITYSLSATIEANGLVAAVTFGGQGTMTYRLFDDGSHDLVEITVPAGECRQLEQTELFRALKSTYDRLNTTDRAWALPDENWDIVYQVGMFLGGTEFAADCASAVRPGDNKGCDCCIETCGSHGACCDAHDGCYKREGCNSFSWACNGPSDGMGPGSHVREILCNAGGGRACAACNRQIMICRLGPPVGPALCCVTGECGEPRDEFGILW